MTRADVDPNHPTSAARPPHRLLYATEAPRALGELALFVALSPLLRRLPTGDGHGVVVLPGFLSDDGMTKPLRSLLCRLGYQAVGWELGRNTRVDDERLVEIGGCVERASRRTGGKVSLIGWSLGGVFAREVARVRPELVRQVISLASPLSADLNHYSAAPLFGRRQQKTSNYHDRLQSVATPPPVPSTSIYSRADGVVAWPASLQNEGPEAENVEVHASHCGIPFNPFAVQVIADRLAQREGAWAPYRPKGWRALLRGSKLARRCSFYPVGKVPAAVAAVATAAVTEPARIASGTRSRTDGR